MNSETTAEVRRYVGAAYAAMARGKWDAAAYLLNQAHLECLVLACRPRTDVPPPGSLAGDYRDLAERATDPGAKAHWAKLAEEETNVAK